jgi:DNA-directed RNA polymerase subunit RPC12/RpoP
MKNFHRAHIDLEYICENCDLNIWITSAQSQEGFIICPYCDKKFSIIPYNSLEKNEVASAVKSNINFDHVKNTIIKLGIKKRECLNIINKVRKEKCAHNTDDFLKKCLSILNQY